MTDEIESIRQEQKELRARSVAARRIIEGDPPDTVEAKAAAALERLLTAPDDPEARREAVTAFGGGVAGWKALREELEAERDRLGGEEFNLRERLSKARGAASQQRTREKEKRDSLNVVERQAAYDRRCAERYRREHGEEPSATELAEYIRHGYELSAFPRGSDLYELPAGYTMPGNREDFAVPA